MLVERRLAKRDAHVQRHLITRREPIGRGLQIHPRVPRRHQRQRIDQRAHVLLPAVVGIEIDQAPQFLRDRVELVAAHLARRAVDENPPLQPVQIEKQVAGVDVRLLAVGRQPFEVRAALLGREAAIAQRDTAQSRRRLGAVASHVEAHIDHAGFDRIGVRALYVARVEEASRHVDAVDIDGFARHDPARGRTHSRPRAGGRGADAVGVGRSARHVHRYQRLVVV
ncbi:conserved hypothetical protein [Ricinus communis]|uniref:Uncharacterized protein n=1 Tax=Ricinus communis TaxID=3988 RepID=B9TK18_RICCO|nr:conserved hypothetical protein [Ricinus communis]